MTSASASLSFFRLLTASRNLNSRNTRKHSREKPKPAVSLPLPPIFYSPGGEATSYTRLPPKDDFKPHPSLVPSTVSDVILLREAPLPAVDSQPKKPSKPAVYVEDDWEEEGGEDQFVGLDWDDDEVIFGSESDDEVINLEGEFDEEEGDVKEKGVPAVMRCFDRAKIYVNAGDGGNGAVAFRREKFVPYGGPSGGDGGRGGNVYVEVDGSMNSLLPFRKNLHYRAGRGGHGLGKKQSGAKGEDVVVKVAPGTVIRESEKGGVEGDVLLELLKPGQRALLLPGGRGGRGNASFKSGTRKVPKIAENGEAGAEMYVHISIICFLFPCLPIPLFCLILCFCLFVIILILLC